MRKRGGGPPSLEEPEPIFLLPRSDSKKQRRPPPLCVPFRTDSPTDLLHARQEGWECLLLAFRAAIRSRGPSFQVFLDQLRSLNKYMNLEECENSGIPMMLLQSWKYHFCDNISLIKIHGHNWPFKDVSRNFFAEEVD